MHFTCKLSYRETIYLTILNNLCGGYSLNYAVLFKVYEYIEIEENMQPEIDRNP